MSTPTDISVRGLRELEQAFESIPLRLQRNVMRAALRAGAKVVAEEAKRRAPVKSGALQKSIRIGSRLRYGVPEASIRAGGRLKDGRSAWYARIIERGAIPHEIAVRAGTASLFINGRAVGKSVQHPGVVAKPFMRPALDTRAREAVESVAALVRSRLRTQHGIDIPDPMAEGDE